MSRNFFTNFTAALTLLALGACGDDGGSPSTGTTEGASSSSSTGDGTTTVDMPTTTSTDPTTTSTDPTTTTTDPTTTTTDPTTTTTDPTTTTMDLTTTDATTVETSMTDGTTGDPLQQCLDMIDPGDMCGECACTQCTDELIACQADEGCTAIRMCAQDSGCMGLDCIAACGDVINMYGGIGGGSAAAAQALGNCVAMSCAERCGG